MYVIPLVVILLIALAIFFSPLLSVILLVLCLIGIGLYKFLAPGAEPEHAPVSEAPGTQTNVPSGREEIEGGMWGEKWPEQRHSQGRSSSS